MSEQGTEQGDERVAGGSGGGADDTGVSSADETSPGSDGDGVEAGYTTPEELAGDPGEGEPTA
ncbi:hypothetical protein ACWFNE_11755 [Cellulomonas sp. NPDC055163]